MCTLLVHLDIVTVICRCLQQVAAPFMLLACDCSCQYCELLPLQDRKSVKLELTAISSKPPLARRAVDSPSNATIAMLASVTASLASTSACK
jgi:competence transcription factor ComK